MSVPNLIGMLPSELEDLAVDLGASRYRGRQLATWIYRKSVYALDAMSDLPKDFRSALSENRTVTLPDVARVTPSQDGSRKLVFRLEDDSRVSAVIMPDDDRITLCLSTQVGCGYACAFCLTGTMGLERNLTAGEIVGQLLAANALLAGDGQRVTHLVFMGMGEPLANFAALVKAVRIFTDAKFGLGYSPRRITVSTVGLVSGIEKLGREDLKVNLAVSLHASSDDVRSRLMPVNKSWNLSALMEAVRKYPLTHRQRVFFDDESPRMGLRDIAFALLIGQSASRGDERAGNNRRAACSRDQFSMQRAESEGREPENSRDRRAEPETA